MDKATKVVREENAYARIDAAAVWLGQRFAAQEQVDAFLAHSGQSGHAREPAVGGLFRREALADFFDAIVEEIKKEDDKKPKAAQLPAAP